MFPLHARLVCIYLLAATAFAQDEGFIDGIKLDLPHAAGLDQVADDGLEHLSYDIELPNSSEKLSASSSLSTQIIANDDGAFVNRVRREADDQMKKPTITKKPLPMLKTSGKDKKAPIKLITSNVTSSSSVTNNNVTSKPVVALSNSVQPTTELSVSDTFFGEENTETPTTNSTQEDTHSYYNSTTYRNAEDAMRFWANFSIFKPEDVVNHEMLSSSHRRAATINLKFDFPFYGHTLKNVTIATGGFLYLGHTVHSWLAATQYIAPLMANFDTSLSNDSNIRYADNGTAFVVQWNNVMLKDDNTTGHFSFQVTLFKSGDIVFVYKDVSSPISSIPEQKHPVKVGISDAYVIDKVVLFIKRKTIYEYHRVDKKNVNITAGNAIYFTALPTCISLKDCKSCLTSDIKFECVWCDQVQRCSDGFDRHRHNWLATSCHLKEKSTCDLHLTTPASRARGPHIMPVEPRKDDGSSMDASYYRTDLDSDHSNIPGAGSAGWLTSLVFIALISGLGLWLFYAYKNPQTSSGQLLIKYRPTTWRWSGSEARYTAASIHM